MSKINCDLINASICLSDLEASQFQIGKDGKKYLNFSILSRKVPDKFGNDLTMSYKKEKGQETKYIKGNAKSVNFDSQPGYRDWEDRKSTRLNSSHSAKSRMPSSA